MRGLDVLQPLVDDPSITEIMINGPHDVFIEKNGHVALLAFFQNNEQTRQMIDSIEGFDEGMLKVMEE